MVDMALLDLERTDHPRQIRGPVAVEDVRIAGAGATGRRTTAVREYGDSRPGEAVVPDVRDVRIPVRIAIELVEVVFGAVGVVDHHHVSVRAGSGLNVRWHGQVDQAALRVAAGAAARICQARIAVLGI